METGGLPRRKVIPVLQAVTLTLLLSFWGGGCSSPERDYVYPRGNDAAHTSFEALLKANPLAPDENFKIIEFLRTRGASHHLVQIRDREKPHIHKKHDITIFLYRGHGRLTLGEATVSLRQGDRVSIPRKTPHAFVNAAKRPAAAYAIITPPFDGKDTHWIEEKPDADKTLQNP